MRALVLDYKSRAEIARVKAWALDHPVSLKELKMMVAEPERAVGNRSEFTCVVPTGYRCVFSLEQQPHGLYRHLSVSGIRAGEGKGPNPAAVAELAHEFGFAAQLEPLAKLGQVWTEKTGEGSLAINVLEKVYE